ASSPTDGEVVQLHVEAIQRRASITPEIAQVEVAEAVARDPVELRDGPEIEVPFQPRALVGSHPVEVLSAEVAGDRVRLELVMERMNGTESWRLVVWLLNRPTD